MRNKPVKHAKDQTSFLTIHDDDLIQQSDCDQVLDPYI